MDLRNLKDPQLLFRLKCLVKSERETVTQVLHHLREVERRKLFSELKYPSLFEYAVRELKYSEGQASRRITAMRLLKELPSIEKKIESGALSLSNVSQAGSFIREKEKKALVSSDEKLEILKSLEHRSAREGQRLLLSRDPQALPKERQRVVSDRHTEMRFVMDAALRQSLEDVRGLLGPRGARLSFSQLLSEMARLAKSSLEIKKFGKRRVVSGSGTETVTVTESESESESVSVSVTGSDSGSDSVSGSDSDSDSVPTSKVDRSRVSRARRSVARSVRYAVWRRARGRCEHCRSGRNLQFDHVEPYALGGASGLDNIRLLCGACNQRAAMRVFGVTKIERERQRGLESGRERRQLHLAV